MEALAGLLALQVGCRVIEHLTNRVRLHDVSLGRFHLTPFDLLGQPNDILWCRHFLCRGFLSHDAALSLKPQEVNTDKSSKVIEDVELGASLELGAWDLELRQPRSR